MVNGILCTTLILAFLGSGLSQQGGTVAANDSVKLTEPEFEGVFFRLNPASAELVALERQTSTVRGKANFLGRGEMTAEINGPKSPIRFKSGEALTFVVRVPSRSTDPQEIIGFYRFRSTKDKRQMSLRRVGGGVLSSESRDTSQDAIVPFTATKYGDFSLKISSSVDLPPGEYVLGLRNSNTSYCFGID